MGGKRQLGFQMSEEELLLLQQADEESVSEEELVAEEEANPQPVFHTLHSVHSAIYLAK